MGNRWGIIWWFFHGLLERIQVYLDMLQQFGLGAALNMGIWGELGCMNNIEQLYTLRLVFSIVVGEWFGNNQIHVGTEVQNEPYTGVCIYICIHNRIQFSFLILTANGIGVPNYVKFLREEHDDWWILEYPFFRQTHLWNACYTSRIWFRAPNAPINVNKKMLVDFNWSSSIPYFFNNRVLLDRLNVCPCRSIARILWSPTQRPRWRSSRGTREDAEKKTGKMGIWSKESGVSPV